MARLLIEIGALSSEVTAANAKATVVLTNYAAHIGVTGTNQQKLDAIVADLKGILTNISVSQAAETASAAAIAAEQADANNKFED